MYKLKRGAKDLQFCPQCGGSLRMQPVRGDSKERLVCQSCRFVFYQDPKVAACTIPLIDGKVVMVRRAHNPGRGLWVFPGGYVDRYETVEQAAIRETEEEVGLQVRLTGLVGVYSYTDSIVVIIVYACEVMGGQLSIDAESAEVRTFAEAEIPWDQLAFTSTRNALQEFFRQRAGPS